jgi:RNA polymerase sigma-70 factor (ECF subfamily)
LVKRTGLHLVSPAPVPEAVLIDRARAGDRDAQEVLVRQHLRDVYAIAYRLLGERDMAEDAAQDAMLNALAALDRFRGESSFRTWLLRIAMNSARTIGRRKTRRREISLVTESHDQPTEDPDPEHAAMLRDEAARVNEQLQRLPPKQRAAVELRVNRGLSYAEVGEVLNCSEGAARVNYHLGIKRLRELMQ